MRCCICGIEIAGPGNDPYGAMWKTQDGKIVAPDFTALDRCCDECVAKYVLPGRRYLKLRRGGNEK